MDNEVVDLIYCPICFEVPKSEIYQCNDGHTICSECVTNLADCPQCRNPLGEVKIRNRALEALRDSICFKCSHHEFGCVVFLPRNELNYHEEECPFQPEYINVCRTLGFTCGFRTNMKTLKKSLIPHLEQDHGAICRQSGHLNLCYGDFIGTSCSESTEDSLWTPIIAHTGPNEQDDSFLLSCVVSNADNTISWSCLQLNELADKSDYYFKLHIKSVSEKVNDLTLSIPCVNLREAVDTLFVETRVFRISTSLLSRYYTENRDLQVYISISKNGEISNVDPDIEPTWVFSISSILEETTEASLTDDDLMLLFGSDDDPPDPQPEPVAVPNIPDPDAEPENNADNETNGEVD